MGGRVCSSLPAIPTGRSGASRAPKHTWRSWRGSASPRRIPESPTDMALLLHFINSEPQSSFLSDQPCFQGNSALSLARRRGLRRVEALRGLHVEAWVVHIDPFLQQVGMDALVLLKACVPYIGATQDPKPVPDARRFSAVWRRCCSSSARSESTLPSSETKRSQFVSVDVTPNAPSGASIAGPLQPCECFSAVILRRTVRL